MHVLITNDDGISAPGILTLARVAVAHGHKVTVCAPQKQMSATGHHLTIMDPLLVWDFDIPGARAYAVEGTPVDSVRIGLSLADEPVDFCLSGINDGHNAGTAIYYSGTAAAAREASMLYIPAIAVSIERGADETMRQNLAEITMHIAAHIMNHPLPRLTFCNINAPALPVDQLKSLALAEISQSFYLDGYEMRTNPRGVSYFWMKDSEVTEKPLPGTDQALLEQGHVTCSFVGPYAQHNDDYRDLPYIIGTQPSGEQP
ncbi:MAG: 5'/3'-nucleotidase SurE [Clostridiales bacterium]|nr:5'/3'-nucleotidase SurE [Clostridiales bacterium]